MFGITNYPLLLKIRIYALLSRNDENCDSRTFWGKLSQEIPAVRKVISFPCTEITTPENLLCWQQQFNDFLHQTTNYIACRLWMYSAVECRLHRVDGQYWWKWKLLIQSIAFSTNISSSSTIFSYASSSTLYPCQ